MIPTTLLTTLGRAIFHFTLGLVCVVLALHVAVTVSLPYLQAFIKGLDRAHSVQMVSSAPAHSPTAIATR